ncbi:MAG: hypothetical protein FWG10_00100 [Eubacteriaceae bacterium]|nr:hypothetical protein [Eubacteriaceae bacterium]
MSLEQNDPKALQNERIQLYEDYYNYKTPKRIPVSMSVGMHILAEQGGVDFFDFQYDYTKLAEQANKVCEILYSDTSPVGGIGQASLIPVPFQLIESNTIKMGNHGYMQHPNTHALLPEDYDSLVEDAYATLLEKAIPRLHNAMADPVSRGNAVHLFAISKAEDAATMGGVVAGLVERFGYYPGAPAGSGGFAAAPYDFLSDQLRSFSGISSDTRRYRDKVIAACDALYPIMFNFGLPSNPHPRGAVSTPLHMPTYMREKDFKEVWLPTYRKLVEQYNARDIRVSMFCEHDWMRYLDILQDLPTGNVMRFEYGDPQVINDKLSKTHFLGGLYPMANVKNLTKEENISEVKRLLDIMMPAGGYIFGFDKNPIASTDIPFDTYCAIAETVRDYGVYSNPGASIATPLNSEKFKIEEAPKVVSKYTFDWDEFKRKYPYTPDEARPRFEAYAKRMFMQNITFCIC